MKISALTVSTSLTLLRWGIFQAGYLPESGWGTIFGNNLTTAPKISYLGTFGKFQLLLQDVKLSEGSYNAVNLTSTQADKDYDEYVLALFWNEKNWTAGLLYSYLNSAATRSATEASSYRSKYHVFEPYFTGKFGPVAIQAEFQYLFGSAKQYDSVGADVDAVDIAGWIDATATFGPVYFGGTFAYVSGDNPDTTDKIEGGNVLSGGRAWSPTLIMWNEDRAYTFGNLTSSNVTAGFGDRMQNAWFYQIRGGVKPIEKLDIMASVSYAKADQKPAGVINSDYGWEVDVTGTYKLTNNLSYMLGVGYLFTGDYYKGTSAANAIQNDYMLINKLTLTF